MTSTLALILLSLERKVLEEKSVSTNNQIIIIRGFTKICLQRKNLFYQKNFFSTKLRNRHIQLLYVTVSELGIYVKLIVHFKQNKNFHSFDKITVIKLNALFYV